MTEREAGNDASSTDASGDRAPLSELAETVTERRNRSDADAFDALFTEQSFEDVAGESIWEDVDDSNRSAYGAVDEVIDEGERTYVVSKRNFCEQCRHLSSPPAVACTHDGTEIREFVDKDHVRVHACPVVHDRGFAEESSLD